MNVVLIFQIKAILDRFVSIKLDFFSNIERKPHSFHFSKTGINDSIEPDRLVLLQDFLLAYSWKHNKSIATHLLTWTSAVPFHIHCFSI